MRLFLLARGALAVLLIILVMVLVSVSIIIGGCIAYAMPLRSWQLALRRKLLYIPLLWGRANKAIIMTGLAHKWDISIPEGLSFDKWYLVIANHQSFTDILILVSLFSEHTPLFKFFYKRELIWSLPLAGLAMWFLDYPHVARYTRDQLRKKPELKQKSLDQIQNACDMLRMAPSSSVNFVEGTRFTSDKHRTQNSPYSHLLKSKPQGVAMVINTLPDELDCLIDVDIVYAPSASLWSLLSGQYQKIHVHAHSIPIDASLHGDYTGDREYRRRFSAWLTAIWEAKDRRIDQLLNADD